MNMENGGGTGDGEAPLVVRPGGWYYGVKCNRCRRWTPIAEDRAAGDGPAAQFEGPGSLVVPCMYPDCDHSDAYEAHRVGRFQQP
jgi:hypothetical protein